MFHVTDACQQLGLRAGAIRHCGVNIEPASTELREQIDSAAEGIRQRFTLRGEIRQLPEIEQLHQILRTVGVKPRRHPPSNQKLLEYAFNKGTLPSINNLVDTYNLVSLQTLCSLGAHDVGQIRTPVELRILTGDETFLPLGSAEPQAVVAGEFGYVDADERVLCRLDSLQADFSKVGQAAQEVLVIVESTTAMSAQQGQAAVDLVASSITQQCGGLAEVLCYPFD